MFSFTTLRPSSARSSTSIRGRLATLATGVVLVAAPVLGATDSVSAVNTLPANPDAIMLFACDSDGGSVEVNTSNIGGQSAVTIDLTFTGRPNSSVTLAPDETAHNVYYSLPDNGVYVATVSTASGWTKTWTFDYVNCFEYFGGITTYCLGEIPYIVGTANKALFPDTVTFDLDGVTDSVDDPDIHVFTKQLVNGVPFSASMSNDADGEFAHLDGSLDCSTPDSSTTIPTTIPPTIPTTSPISTPETPMTVSQEGEATTTVPGTGTAPLVIAEAPAISPTPSIDTQLPETGTNNGVIGVSAAIILFVGIALRRLASRAARSTR